MSWPHLAAVLWLNIGFYVAWRDMDIIVDLCSEDEDAKSFGFMLFVAVFGAITWPLIEFGPNGPPRD